MPKLSPQAQANLDRVAKAKNVDEAEAIVNKMKRSGHFGDDPKIWSKVQSGLAKSRAMERNMQEKNAMEITFFNAFADELEKLSMCGKPHGKKKGLDTQMKARFGKKAEKMVYCPRRKKMIPASEMGKKAMDDGAGAAQPHSNIKAKIEAARRDPSTKKNPKDTGPPGSGTQDPRFMAMKKRAALLDIYKRASNGLAFSPTFMRKGSSRVRSKPRKPLDPKTVQVRRFEGEQMFKDIGKKQEAS